MAKFEVGQRVKCTFDEYNPEDGWNGFGVVDKVPSVDIPTLYGVAMEGDKGYYAHLRAEEMELATAITVFQTGDIVRAEKGNEIIQGEVFIDAGDQTLYIDISFGAYVFTLEELAQEGYTLTLVKRPEPEIVLPTKPGMYFAMEIMRDKTKHHTDGKIFFYLNSDGEWVDVGWGAPEISLGALKVYENE